MRKHAVTSLLVLLAGIVFQVSRIEWLFLLLSIFLVIAFEILNSAIENVVDLASHYHFDMLAKKAKDMAAGAVLVVSLFAAVTGLIISSLGLGFAILNIIEVTMTFKSGFVAILGRPNVGKSTF